MVSCVGVSRFILVILNFLLFLIGAFITAAGVLVLFSPATVTDLPLGDGNLETEINGIINSTYVNAAAWVCIAVGVIIIIVSLCGCLGSAFTNTALLGIYIFVVIQIILVQAAICVIIYLSPQWFNTAVESTFEKHLSDSDPDISKGWDVLQLSVGCCGLNGTESYMSLTTADFARYQTCCTVADKSIAAAQFLNATNSVVYSNETSCMQQFNNPPAGSEGNFVNNIGCVDKVFQTIQMFAIIGLAVVAIEIFIVIISCVVCCNAKDDKAI